MNSNKIISFENGVLYIRLRESLNTSEMSLSHTIAEISRDGIHIVCADSKGEIASNSMRLTGSEMDSLEDGRLMVKRWWDSNPLGQRCVLLECGHVVNWDEWNETMNSHCDTEGTYTLPYEGSSYCFECERTHGVHRFNEDDFIRES